jgi:hypothetical protein
MKHLSLVRVAAAAAALALITTVAAAQGQGSGPQGEHAVEGFYKRINGTWILYQRINPDGSEHAQPISGFTIFDLRMRTPSAAGNQRPEGSRVGAGRATPFPLAPYAEGTFYSEEYGTMDEMMSEGDVLYAARNENRNRQQGAAGERVGAGREATTSTGGRAAAPRLQAYEQFQIMAEGAVEVRVLADDNSTSILSMRYPQNIVKGNYGVFREGVTSPELESVYRHNKARKMMVGGREVTQGGDAALVNEPRMNLNDSQRGERGGPGDSSHVVRRHHIRGNVMEIEYGNGGRDIWIRESDKPMNRDTVRQNLNARAKARAAQDAVP